MEEREVERYNTLKREFSEIRNELKRTSAEKEKWFNKKEELKKEINELIREVKRIKNESDSRNIKLGELKKQRDEHNQKVKKLIEDIKKVTNEKKSVLDKLGIKSDPSHIQRKINELEQRVEHETSFKKEQKFMEEIKRLKKTHYESCEAKKYSDAAENIEKEIKDVKAKADEFHRKLKELTKNASYKEFMKISKKITRLKRVQEDAFRRFIEFKNKFLDVQKKLKEKQKEIIPVREKMHSDREFRKKERNERENRILEQKEREVEEKLRSKRRLTTEDLIALQKR